MNFELVDADGVNFVTRGPGKYADLRKALREAPTGKMVVVPVPDDRDPQRFQTMLLQALRASRSGMRLTTRSDRKKRLVYIAEVRP